MPRIRDKHGEHSQSALGPRVNVNDPPAFIIHEVKNAVGHVKKNATAWKIAMKKERLCLALDGP